MILHGYCIYGFLIRSSFVIFPQNYDKKVKYRTMWQENLFSQHRKSNFIYNFAIKRMISL